VAETAAPQQEDAMVTWKKTLAALWSVGMLSGGMAWATDPSGDLASSDPYQRELQMHWSAGNYDAALQTAEQIVALAQTTVAPGSYELAAPLHNLAVVQRTLQQFERSEHNFTRSIDILSETRGQFAPLLVASMSQLGVLRFQTQRFAESLDTLRQAQHIAHRNDGVFTLKQLEIVHWITKVNVATGKFLAADLQQRFAYRVSENNYGASDERMIPAMSKLGNWYRDTGQYKAALQMYQKALQVTESNHSDRDLRLVPSLRAISSTMYLQGRCCPNEPLDRALDIVVREPSTDAADELSALMHLADMSLLTSKAGDAKKLYRRAWDMLANEDRVNREEQRLFATPARLGVSRVSHLVTAYEQAETRRPRSAMVKTIKPPQSQSSGVSFSFKRLESKQGGLVGMPLALCYPQVLNLVRGDGKKELSEYYMDLDFSVNHDGRVSNIEVVEGNTPSRLVRYVKNILRVTRFRPRLKEGEPVVTDNMTLRQTFAPTQFTDRGADDPHNVQKTAVVHGCNLLAAASH
jgi:tetratricopeptide (TPR) repeat protein